MMISYRECRYQSQTERAIMTEDEEAAIAAEKEEKKARRRTSNPER